MQIADIDFCVPGDAAELYAIECECFEQPWERHVIEADLFNLGAIIYLKASFKDEIAGYGVLTRQQRTSHLLNLGVRADFRGRGVATQLMLALGEISLEWRCTRMRLEVRSSNRGARDFYAQLGFQYMTRMRGYYEDGEDALVLASRLPLAIS